MGTWDLGPFDNDTAADFAGDLYVAAVEAREFGRLGVQRAGALPWGGRAGR
ncbi:DUF4259 domain-containing protein [Streptomyces clavifer]